ncbi:sodium-dependent bicarbonate transport family permease [Candidatus Acetothermia bacterium]|nr:sodium-dependent bicarbonate transport family permease [Candidatus Acetothermia bacterium]
MDLLDLILTQVLSPPILFFALGIMAGLVKSDLKIPESMSIAMLIFLLAAIGLDGGVGISKVGIGAVLAPAAAAMFLGVSIVLLGFTILTKLKFDIANAGGISGHYGAVSAATMVAGLAFLDGRGVPYEAFIPALYPMMDSPAILTAILLTRFALAKAKLGTDVKIKTRQLIKESVSGKAVLLLIASMIIGYVAGYRGAAPVKPFFDGMFKGVLCLFLLDMGIVAAVRLKEWKEVGTRLLVFALVMPPIHGIAGVLFGSLTGLSAGGATMLGVLAGSASYISAPAAIRAAIPEANPSLSLTASVALTFPFNIIIGIPLYAAVAQMIIG